MFVEFHQHVSLNLEATCKPLSNLARAARRFRNAAMTSHDQVHMARRNPCFYHFYPLRSQKTPPDGPAQNETCESIESAMPRQACSGSEDNARMPESLRLC